MIYFQGLTQKVLIFYVSGKINPDVVYDKKLNRATRNVKKQLRA